jgi:hypothetical protein
MLNTPNRDRLADLQKQDSEVRATITADSANANRLNVIHEAVEPARAALATYDADHAAAMANWARGLVTGRPKADANHRETLARALADAEQNSNAAKAAQAGFQASVEQANAPLARLKLAIREAAKVVAIEEASEMLPKITDAIAKADDLHRQLDAAREAILSGLEFGSTDFNEARQALQGFDVDRNIAEARPMTSDNHGEGWRRFLAALEKSASIDFEGAQTMALQPTPFNPTALDPATAAMLAAASFPTL